MNIAVIVPTLNESAVISATLEPLQSWRKAGHKVVVVDGGSKDTTVELATPLADLVIKSAAGRARQMNAGAAACDADVYLFLHADTLIDKNAFNLVIDHLGKGKCWGRFDVRFDDSQPIFQIIALMMNWRSRLTAVATGDQAIFIEKSCFTKVGQYPDMPLMEDVQLSKQCRQQSRPACINTKVVTAARRWRQNGILRTIFLMWILRLAYFVGVSPGVLYRLYYR